MNSQIEAWRVQAFSANVYHTSQQEGSMIAPYCRHEMFTGKAEFFDRLGESTAQDKTGRNTDTPNFNTAHSRRMVTTVTREWGTLVDRKDKLQNIHSPQNEYVKSAAWGIGRRRDQVLIEAAFGTAYTGESGGTATTLGNTAKVAAVDSGVLAYPNTQLVRKAALRFNQGKVKGRRVLFYAADFLDAMLSETETTSSDFAAVKALVDGSINTWMGFTWIHCEELNNYLATTFDADTFKWDSTTGLYSSGGTTVAATDKVALCLAEGGLIEGETIGSAISRVDERNDKGYSGQVYSSIDQGGVRMEEVKVCQLIYKA